MPSTPYNFTMFRGLTWQGLRCIAVNASNDAVAIAGTGLLQARKALNKPVAFALPVTFGGDTGEIIIPEVSAIFTAALPLGAFMYDMVLIDTDGKAWPPVMGGIITIRDSASKPELL